MSKVIKKKKDSTKQLIGIQEINDFSIKTQEHGELIYFSVKPTNISVLSEESIRARIYALMVILKGVAEIEICCLDSAENFEENKRYLKARISSEQNHAVRKLLEQDLRFLDEIQTQMATAREFLIILRILSHNEKEMIPYLNRIEKILRDQRFHVRRVCREEIKRILAVYFEQNVTHEKFEDFDGERWIILGD
jgi:hypothetical protein